MKGAELENKKIDLQIHQQCRQKHPQRGLPPMQMQVDGVQENKTMMRQVRANVHLSVQVVVEAATMSAGGNAIASCSDSSTAGSVNVTVGIGGAGAHLLGKCVGGGGASVGTTGGTGGSPNRGTLTLNEATKTPCKDPNNNNQDVAGTFSGGGSGADISSGAANTGGGGSGRQKY